jgi:hypothetical protein
MRFGGGSLPQPGRGFVELTRWLAMIIVDNGQDSLQDRFFTGDIPLKRGRYRERFEGHRG